MMVFVSENFNIKNIDIRLLTQIICATTRNLLLVVKFITYWPTMITMKCYLKK